MKEWFGRLWFGAAGVLLLLAVLTWLLLRGIDTNAPAYAIALQAFDDFALAQASLHRDVLQARAGLLRNYDNLGSSLEAMERAVVQLRSYAESQGIDTTPVERLAATVAQQEELTEHFKTSNALFQNSISYVGQLSRDSAFGAKEAEFARATGALAAAILRLLHDTSLDSVSGLGERIDQLDEQVSRVGLDAEPTRGLLAHARLLREVLPTVDATLRSLIAVPSREPLEATRALFGYHHAAVETTARRYRLLLYLASLFLLVALVRLGLQLRARARALRQRATFERIIAETSTSLINCPTEETTARLDEVLAKLGRAIGVERAYVVLEGGAARVHAWCAEGTTCRPGWPAQALALFEELGHPGPDILTVPEVNTLPPGAAKKTLEAAGVRGWACVPLTRPGRIRGVMGFDTAAPAWDKVFPLPVLRLAGDAVINAIEREFLERDRATLAARLERARRMQMIGWLASGIAHNFNNIIGAILGYSEMIEPRLAPGTEPAQHVDEIRRAAERGRDLIDHILTFGQRGETRMQRIGMPTLFEEAGSLLSASLPASAQLIIGDVAADVAVVGEPSELQQVILNLCTNAAQAMEGGGVIRVAAERRDITAPLVLTHGELRAGRYVCLSVSDNGRGFDDGVARRLFEPFFTTRRAGTGLGLATVQEIVRDHDGAMNVQSKPGSGSRFEAWFPAISADDAVATSRVLPLGRGETVLVVDAERERLLRDEEMLAALGYEPVGFEHAADAIAACRSAPKRFDAALISLSSTAPNGLDTAHSLRELMLRKPILLAADSRINVSIDALVEVGMTELLNRPLVNTEVASVLARCLRLRSELPM